MAITQEQANQLASTYQSGDTAGLQSLVNQMGVTSGDVAQYFPGFNVSTIPGLTLASPTTTPVDTTGIWKTGDAIPSYWQSDSELARQAANQEWLTTADALRTQQNQDWNANALAGFLAQDPTLTRQEALQKLNEWNYAPDYYGRGQSQTGYDPSGALYGTNPGGWKYNVPESQSERQALINVLDSVYSGTPTSTARTSDSTARNGFGTENFSADQIIDYITKNLTDPTRIAQAAKSFNITPEDIFNAYQTKGLSPYSLQQMQDFYNQGITGFVPRVQQITSNIFGTEEEQKELETLLQKQFNNPNISLSNFFNPAKFSNMSLEDVEKTIRNSDVNKIQDAIQLSNIAKTTLGYTNEDANDLISKAYNGKLKSDSIEGQIYDALLNKNNITGSDYDKLMSYAAVNNPNAPVFKENPKLIEMYTPLGELKSAPNNEVGQYNYINNAPTLSLSEADRLRDGKLFVGGLPDAKTGFWDEDTSKLGWNLNSKYASSIATGSGIFGVKNSASDIDEFDRIEKALAKSGGIRTVNYGEGPVQVAKIETTDPDTGQKIFVDKPLDSIFRSVDADGMETGTGYQDYLKTKSALEAGAKQFGLDVSKYSSIKDLYDAVNEKAKDLYVVTGRANKWDPEVAKTQGITGVGQDRGGVNHAQVLYKAVGDKLVPIQTLKTFNFDDPNTSRGVFGDLLGGIGEIMSVPPIALAFAAMGGLPALLTSVPEQALAMGASQGLFGTALGTPYAAGAVNTLANSIGSTVASGLSPGVQNLIGRSLLNAGTSALTTGIKTGDLEKAGIAGLSGGIGAGVSGGLPMLLGDTAKDIKISPSALKLGSEIAGGAAATAITGQDAGAYAINRLIGAGISALTDVGAKEAGIPTTGPGKELFNAILPIIISKNVDVNDVMRLSQAVNKFQSQNQKAG